jgi:UDP-N-acetylmuramoyl-tripeptide--D-alanyl-D-alanine ligase
MGGAFAFGEIALLARIAKPRVALVTNVFPVHIERMGSIEAIAETKAELVEAVPRDGVAILHGDDSRVAAMKSRCSGRVVTYGLSPEHDVWADSVVLLGLGGCSFRLHLGDERVDVDSALVGGHAVQLALAGIAVGHVLGMAVPEMLPGLQDPAVQKRLRRLRGPAGSLLLDDTYNASTPSMLSGLQLLEDAVATRRVAVLGDMRELGSLSEAEHRFVGERAGDVVDLLVTYGDEARIMAGAAVATTTVDSFDPEQRDELIAFLRSELRPGDVVLVKGSRALRMEEIVDALAEPG